MFKNVDELINLIPSEWRAICNPNLFKLYFWNNIIMKLNETPYYPSKNNIFKAFELVKPDDVKVVIIGQDPYINKDQATGLSFSVAKGLKIPPSLLNIYKEIVREYDKTVIIDKYNGDLTPLAEQGVLFLNTILTVEPNKSGSHKNIGWEYFTTYIIKKLDKHYKLVFMGFGKFAEKLINNVVKYNPKLITGHPSPLNRSNPFIGCNCFKDCNEILENKLNKTKINWLGSIII